MKTEILKIQLKLNGKTIELTTEEAIELRGKLNSLFGADAPQKDYFPFPIPYPAYTPPVVIEMPYTPYNPFQTWCGDTGNLISDHTITTSIPKNAGLYR